MGYGRWLVQCRSVKEGLSNLKTLKIQVDDESYGSLGEDFVIGREDVILDIRADAGEYPILSTKLRRS